MSDVNEYRKAILSMYDDVDMPGGWKWNHMKTLQTIDLFSSSQYSTGAYDDQGYYKFFRDISTAPCDVASKFIDIDVQNFRFIPRPGIGDSVLSNELCVYHLSKDFKIYADENKFGALINQLGDDLPKYGSIFVKDVKGKAMRVSPHNLKFDPAANTLRESWFVAEPKLMRKNEIMRMAKKWNKFDNFQEVLDRGTSDMYLIYFFYENQGDKWEFKVLADVFAWKNSDGSTLRSLESNINQRAENLPAICLHEDEVKDIPYYDHKWKHMDGRLLGYGYVEYLIPNQIATNEAENLERKGLYYSSLVLLQTRDQGTGGKNILTDAKNGDILVSESELLKVPLEERNLAAYNATQARWADNTVLKTFSSDIATGQNLPSRTPLGVANVQASMVTSFYEKKRENFGLFLKDSVLTEIVIPSFKEKSAKEHMLTIGSDEKDIEEYERFITKIYVDKAVTDYVYQHGFFPSKAQRLGVEDRVLRQLKAQKYKNIKIMDYYYDNAMYKMEIDVTGESVDTGVRSQIMQTAMQILGANPAILQNATTRAIFFRFLGLGGVNPGELGIDTANIDMTPVAPGGSVASPTAPTPMMGQAPQTLA